MLIRICDHFKDNPKRIDKLIAIKGLPEDWIYRDGPQGKELRKPWEPDIDKNIPAEVRHLCEPTYLVFRYPPIHAGQSEIVEKRQILGIRLDYNTEPGRQLWDDIERYIEETMPRGERIPVPVVCAKDERSAFETYTPRRNSRGSLELITGPVPFVDLTKYVPVKMVEKPIEAYPETQLSQTTVQNFKCEECDYEHVSPRGVRMHSLKRHPKKEKVGA